MKIVPLLLAFAFCSMQLAADPKLNSYPPKEALKALMKGHQRFMNEESEHPHRTSERRLETAEKQEPFAAIVGCSDSRVSPEIIFDQGIGDLFIVRVAGNVIGPVELASVEYSAVYLHSSLIVILGHENCAAVGAVLAGKTKDIEPVAKLIAPAAKNTVGQGPERLENTIKENVRLMAEGLKKNPVLNALIEKKKLAVVGAYYHFQTGEVEFLNDI